MHAAWFTHWRNKLIHKDPAQTRKSTSHESAGVHPTSLIQLHQMGMLRGSRSEILSIVFSPDETLLAAATVGEIRLWDVQQRQCIQRLSVPNRQMPKIAFSPDGNTIAAVDEEIRLWSWKSDQATKIAIPELYATGVAFSPDGTILATGDKKGNVYFLEPITGQLRGTFAPAAQVMRRCDSSSYSDFVFLPDGSRLFQLASIRGPAGLIQIWNINPATKQAIWHSTLHDADNASFSPIELTCSPDGQLLASVYHNNNNDKLSIVALYPTTTLKLEEQITLPSDEYLFTTFMTAIAFSPDSSLLAIADIEGTIWLWNLERHAFAARVEAHPDVAGPFSNICSFAWAKSSILATGGWESRGATTFEEKFVIKLWQVIKTE